MEPPESVDVTMSDLFHLCVNKVELFEALRKDPAGTLEKYGYHLPKKCHDELTEQMKKPEAQDFLECLIKCIKQHPIATGCIWGICK